MFLERWAGLILLVSAWYQPSDIQNPKILDEINNNIHDYSWIMNHLNVFGTFSSVYTLVSSHLKFLDNFEMTRPPLRTKLQIKEVDSVTKIIKSHQKVSLRTILHVNIIIKSLRPSAIGYFLTIITIWPIETRQKASRDSKKWSLDLTFVSCDFEWPSRRAYNQISIQIFEIHSFKPNIIGSKNSKAVRFRTSPVLFFQPRLNKSKVNGHSGNWAIRLARNR